MTSDRLKALTSKAPPRTRRCSWCQLPYDEYGPRSQVEMERLHQTLFVTGDAAREDRPICDTCYDNVVLTTNKLNNASSLDVGGSNRGPPNLLLQRSVEEKR